MSRVVHFEFSTPDPTREIEFFSSLFGWKIQSWGDQEYWLVDSGTDEIGINGAILPQSSPAQPRVVDTVTVEDLAASIDKAIEGGATVAMGKQEVAGVGWTAYLISPTGIMFGMLQPMPGSMSQAAEAKET